MHWTAQDRGKKDSQRGPWPAWLRRRLPSADARMRSPANLAAALACRAAAAACRAAAAACRHASSGLRRCRPAAAAPAETSMQESVIFDWRLLLLYECTFSKSEVKILYFGSVLLAVGFSSKDQTPESVTAMVTPEHLAILSLTSPPKSQNLSPYVQFAGSTKQPEDFDPENFATHRRRRRTRSSQRRRMC